jgi:L-fuconolactonase
MPFFPPPFWLDTWFLGYQPLVAMHTTCGQRQSADQAVQKRVEAMTNIIRTASRRDVLKISALASVSGLLGATRAVAQPKSTLTIDSQVHAYERDHPGRPWAAALTGPPEVTGDNMVAAMDAVGVDGAVLVSPFSMYRYDASYVLSVHAAHPGRFALVKPVDPGNPAVAETVANWAATKGTVGIRLFLVPAVSADPADPGLNRALAAAAQHSIPVNLACPGRLEQVGQLAARNPNTRLVIDHLGLNQPFEPPAPADAWADLPKLLALAAHPNIAVKISGACTLSHEPFPYKDIWDPLFRVFDAFSLNRCMWGTDWTRAVKLLTYKQGVEAFRVTDRLSDSDRATLMGETLSRGYNWSPSKA